MLEPIKFESIPQDIIDKVNQQMNDERKEAKKKGKLTKQEMILLYNILNNLYDCFDVDSFGCSKKEYMDIITRLDGLTE